MRRAGVLAIVLAAALWPLAGRSTGQNLDALRWLMPIRSFYVASESVAPTIVPGQHFLAARKRPEELHRGDLIVYRVGNEAWVKRVAAVPGDTIEIRDGIVILNGARVAQVPAGEGPVQQGVATKLYTERFPDEAAPHRIIDMGPRFTDTLARQTLAPDMLFVLGDNRDDSVDSRLPAGQFGDGGGPVSFARVYGIVDPASIR